MTKDSSKKDMIPPSLAWLTVFVPALAYFLATRFHSTHGHHSSYPIVTDQVDSALLGSVFYLQPSSSFSSQQQQPTTTTTTPRLQHSLFLLEDSFQQIVASVWKHDSDLGRGYLLLSDAHANGRIWRFERGGGPIPIGRTLFMDPSGCRSQPSSVCPPHTGGSSSSSRHRNGSGGLAVDFDSSQKEYRQGRPVLAEWGERRIVRLEGTTGARTPLVIQVPNDGCHPPASSSSSSSSTPPQQPQRRRVERPSHMVYTPFGDLLFLESSSEQCHTVMKLTQAGRVPPLPSAMESRMAHKWNDTHHNHSIDILYKEKEIKSMALDSTGLGLYLTVRRAEDDSVVLVHLSLVKDDDDDDDTKSLDPNSSSSRGEEEGGGVKVVFNFHATSSATTSTATAATVVDAPPQAMAVDERNHVFLSVPTGVMVLDKDQVLGTLATPTPITSLTLGEDKYLYITTNTQLLRIRVRHGPPKIPTGGTKPRV